MRMVEKLRSLPHVIIVLPIYKRVITEAFAGVLGVSSDNAATFLRKLTDFEVSVDSNLELLKDIFIKDFNANEVVIAGMPIAELCWYILLHNIVIREALERFNTDEKADIRKAFEIGQSPYLHRIKNLFSSHRNITSQGYDKVRAYPSHFGEQAGDQYNEFFVPLGIHYQSIGNADSDSSTTAIQLSEMRNKDNVMKLITTDGETEQSMHQPGRITFSSDTEAKSSAPALTELFIPLLKESNEEPLVTDNYKPRDILDISRRIQGNHVLDLKSDSDLSELYLTERAAYDRYRT